MPKEDALRLRAVDLVVEAGPDAGLKKRVTHGTARIGTAPGSDLKLSDRAVSRLHCEIHVRPDGVVLVDSGSTNGTFASGLRVREVEVAATTLIEVGSTRIRVELSQRDSVEIPLSSHESFGPMLGSSVAMRRVYAMLERIAPTEATVLITGETGTGKEVAARAIHLASPRAKNPYVVVDCAALPPHLMESELFGHSKGAFSGAMGDRAGLFEEADGGTIFLDELGELPATLQPKLLRVLETRTVRRLGTNQSRPVDVRILAATNRSLAEEVNRGMFREDLYYRIAVIEVRLPPLRERGSDAAHLAKAFYAAASSGAAIPSALVAEISARAWPGNVRELKNFVERTVSLSRAAPDVGASNAANPQSGAVVAASAAQAAVSGIPFKEARKAWTMAYVRGVLERNGNNVTHAAQMAGISRRFLQRLIERAGDDDE